MRKNRFKVIQQLPKKIRVLMILVSILCVGILGTTILNKVYAKQTQTIQLDENYVRTIFLGKGSLDETVSATGNIESQETSNVSATSEAEIQNVLVNVGDTVEEGDVICTLDSSDLQKKIDKARETQTTSKETNQTNYDNALAAKESAWNSLSTQKTTTDNYYTAYQKALSEYQVVESSINTQQNLFNTTESTLQTKGINLSQKEGACLAKGYLSDCSDSTSSNEYTEYITAKNEYDLAKQEYETAKNNLDQAKNNSNFQTLYNEMTSTKAAYENANSQLTKLSENFSTADAKVNETYKTLTSNSSSTTELNDLLEQLEDYTLKAKTSGKVTSLNATVGSKATGTIATIQNTNSLKIAFSIDEYDIQKISVGMSARITSDAVDEELTGTVTQISPTATAGSNGSSSGFQVEVEITSSNSDLLIGMSAKVEILISSTDDVFTVPLDAIEEKEDGTSVIYVKNDKGEFEAKEVTVGNKTDYLAEISGPNVEAGLEVRASAKEEEATVNDTDTNFSQEMSVPGAPSGGVIITESSGDMPQERGNRP
ncbi:efflux RND transporter periplasmic adaptor subunit [Anaerorhabdus sp.]|uniref:efflux RND transporter periplasmic adaptor subunit n=1 Tax=Anaerorhabdus sp. TaxID=1872524 RepID=UPI002FCB406B